MLTQIQFIQIPAGRLIKKKIKPERSVRNESYLQRNFTIDEKQRELVEKYHGVINNRSIACMLGVTYNILHKNLVLMGKVKSRPQTKAKVIKINIEFFNEEEFFKEYKY